MKPESLFIDSNGLKLHVNCWGDPGKPPLILLHGMRDHSRSWDWIAQALVTDYRIFAPDLRGHGDSSWAIGGGYSLANFVFDLEVVSLALGLDRFAIVGHSFGGAIALRYASIFPDKVIRLAGIECAELPLLREQRESPKPYPQRLREWVELELQRRSRSPRFYATLADAEERMRSENQDLSAETVAHLARHGVIATGDGGWRWKFDSAARARAPADADGLELDQMLDAIACPVMLAYGTASWVPIPPQERLDRIRQLSLIEFPGASHWLHHTLRDAFTAAVHSFLSALPER